MNIIVLTVKRNVDFVHQTIKSIKDEIPYYQKIHLLVGGNDYSYLNDYDKGFIKHVDLYEIERDLPGSRKAAYGYYRCLTLNRNKDCLIVEDDVILNKNWFTILNYFIERMSDKLQVFSFITPLDGTITNSFPQHQTVQQFNYICEVIPAKGLNHASVKVQTWVNSSVVYYPKEVLQTRLPEFLYKYGVEEGGIYDLILGYYFFQKTIPIFIFVPNLAINIGNEAKFSAMKDFDNRKHIDYSDWYFD